MDNILILSEMGYTVDVACNFRKGSTISKDKIDEFVEQLSSMGINYYQIDFARSAVDIKNHLNSVKQVRKLIKHNNYSMIHTHGPISSAIVRWAARSANIPLIYTAHGFQFCKGGPALDWVLFYPIEKYLSKYTDLLITINKEDYSLAKSNFKACQTVYVPGVGIDISKFARNDEIRLQKRTELGLRADDIVLFSVGELSIRKNHQVVIKAIAQIKNRENIKYFIAGQGGLKENLAGLVGSLCLENNVCFLDYRSDIAELLSAADIFVLPSLREGLAVAGMEAMAAGLPIIGSDARGIADYIVDGQNGFVCPANSVSAFADAIEKLINDRGLIIKQGKQAVSVVKQYEKVEINNIMKSLYEHITV